MFELHYLISFADLNTEVFRLFSSSSSSFSACISFELFLGMGCCLGNLLVWSMAQLL